MPYIRLADKNPAVGEERVDYETRDDCLKFMRHAAYALGTPSTASHSSGGREEP